MLDVDVRKRFQAESERLVKILDEDEEVMWQYWECFWAGNKRAAVFIDNQIRSKTRTKVGQQIQVMNRLVEAL